MKFLSFACLFTIILFASCGNSIEISESDEIVDFPDIEAKFPGGPDRMKRYLAKNIRYPETAMELGDQGKVYVEFVVEKDGSLSNVHVVRGVSKEIDKESVRVISNMPNWKPAINNNEYVRARCRVPINFILQ